MNIAALPAGSRIGLVQAGNIGDIVATLPMAGAIKAVAPETQIVFIGRRYGEAVAMASRHVDGFLDSDVMQDAPGDLARERIDILLNPFPNMEMGEAGWQAGIPVRIGNLRRGKGARWCNCFVFYGRSGSGKHEAALNMRELRPLGIKLSPSIPDMARLAGLTRLPPLAEDHRALLQPGRFHLLLHAKSLGNAREWPLASFLALVRSLPADRVQVLLTGTAAEGDLVRAQCPELLVHASVTETFGRFDLPQFMAFVAACSGMVAASTGPLHLAAVLGIHALGLYPGRNGMDATRWAPLGVKGEAVQFAPECVPGPGRCPRHGFPGGACWCTRSITPETVRARVMAWVDEG